MEKKFEQTANTFPSCSESKSAVFAFFLSQNFAENNKTKRKNVNILEFLIKNIYEIGLNCNKDQTEHMFNFQIRAERGEIRMRMKKVLKIGEK